MTSPGSLAWGWKLRLQVEGLGFWSLGFRALGLGFKVWGLGSSLGHRVRGSGLGLFFLRALWAYYALSSGLLSPMSASAGVA